MKITVVIPVYNAGRFVERAVASALEQPETTEVVLVEDGSPDDSLAVCESLQSRHARIRLLRHPGGQNLGAGASRTLGVEAATHEWIAFLDADDFYLPNRFKTACRLIRNDPSLDGVYESVGVQFDSEQGRINAQATGRDKVITFERPVAPEEMFEAQSPIGSVGYVHLDGLLVRRQAAMNAGLFVAALRLHQDTEFLLRLPASCRLTTGEIEHPVALRGLHDDNRISRETSRLDRYRRRALMWKYLYAWSRRTLPPNRQEKLEAAMAGNLGVLWTYAGCRLLGRWQLLRQFLVVLRTDPALLRAKRLRRRFVQLALNP